MTLSIVRSNLLTRPGYSPYCGGEDGCSMPRTHWNGSQFLCHECGWESEFPDAFIEEYRKKWGLSSDGRPAGMSRQVWRRLQRKGK